MLCYNEHMNNHSHKGDERKVDENFQRDPDAVEIAELMPDEDTMIELAELYKIFGDHTRIRILCALSAKDMHVSGIADTLGMTQSAISHQLRILKSARLVRFKRDGKSMVYGLADDHVRTLIDCALEHIAE